MFKGYSGNINNVTFKVCNTYLYKLPTVQRGDYLFLKSLKSKSQKIGHFYLLATKGLDNVFVINYNIIEMKLKTLAVFKTKDNKEPFNDWLHHLDNSIRGRVFARFRRIEEGNYGDHKRFGGILELRFDFGKGYRIYCGEDGDTFVILLTAGDKNTQQKDIGKAIQYWEDYNEQKKI